MINNNQLRRVLAFSDAIVAVAITLLVLPLTDLFQENRIVSLSMILSSAKFYSVFSSLIVSFFVIFGFWNDHNTLFKDNKKVTKLVLRLNELWCFSIILIPAITSMSFNINTQASYVIYGFGLWFSAMTISIMKFLLLTDKPPITNTLLLLTISILLLLIFPKIDSTIYYIVFLAVPLNKIFPKLA
ncbi:TMEM175 family protein [Leuconostoc pseudomesenteroides]|uniref:TMEM175 family protein n=2 Tax=Leuconostoc TaxID=1243 RepID=UPI00301D7CB8